MPSNRSLFLDKCSMYFTLKSLFKIPSQAFSDNELPSISNHHSLNHSNNTQNNIEQEFLNESSFSSLPPSIVEEEENSKRKSWFFNRRNSTKLKNQSPNHDSQLSNNSNSNNTSIVSTTTVQSNNNGLISMDYDSKRKSISSSPSGFIHQPPSNNSSSLHRQIYSSNGQPPPLTTNSSSNNRKSTTPEKRRSIFKLFSNSSNNNTNIINSPSNTSSSTTSSRYSVKFTKNNKQHDSPNNSKKKRKANFVILIFIRGIWSEECVNYLQQLDKILWDKISKEFGGNMAAIISGTREQALQLKNQLNLRFEIVSDERMILAEKYNMNCVMKGSIVYNKVENMYKNRYMTKTGSTITDYLFEIIEFIDKKQSQNNRKKKNRKQKSDNSLKHVKKQNQNNHQQNHNHSEDIGHKRDSHDAFSSINTHNNRNTIGSELNDISLIISDDDNDEHYPSDNVNNIEIDEKFIVEFFETKWKQLFNVDNKLNTGFTQPGVLIINRNKKVIYSWKDGYSLTQQQEHVQQLILQQEMLRQQEEQKTRELDNFLSEWDFNTWLNENSHELHSQNNSLELNDSHKKHLSDEIKKAFRKTISNPSYISHSQRNSLSHHLRNSISQSSSITNNHLMIGSNNLNSNNNSSKSPTTPSSSIGSPSSLSDRLKKHSLSNDDVSSYPSGSLVANLQIAKASNNHVGIERNDTNYRNDVKRRPSSDPLKSFFREEIDKQEKLQAKEQFKKKTGHVSFNFVASSNNSNVSRGNLLIDRSFVEERIPPKHLLTIVEYYLSIQDN